jgi:hypothetical protein
VDPQKYQTFMRRYIEVTPARRDLCFAPTDEGKWSLILRQEANIDPQIERKTRLLWEMQEVDLKRRQDEQWQEIVRQEEEAAKAREAEARAQQEEQARMIYEAAAQIAEHMKEIHKQKIKEQSRRGAQVAENKPPVSVEEQGSAAGDPVPAGSGAGEQRPVAPAVRPVGGPESQESTSDPVAGSTEPTEAPQKA